MKTQTKLVICHLCNFASPYKGNFMASLFYLEKKLEEANADNKVIYIFYRNASVCDWVKEMVQNNKRVYFFNDNRIKGILELKRNLKNNNVNVLHLHFCFPMITLILLRLFCLNLQIILHFHMDVHSIPNSLINRLKHKTKTEIEKFICNHTVNKVCAVSEAVFNDLVKYKMHKNCSYIDNGIDFSRLDFKCEDGKKMYHLLDKKVAMIYGTAFHRKGVDIAIHAIKDIVNRYNLILMIICQNKNYVLEQIKILLNEIPEWILIVPSQENIPFYLKMSDVYLTPSRGEAFSYLMLESIYCGTPVIRSDYPGMNRGLPFDMVVSISDVTALQKSIISVLSMTDVEKQAILSEQKEYIVKRWNIDIWSDKILKMYLQHIN